MTISLSIFYFLYLIALVVFIFFSLFNVYHLLRFGFLTATNFFLIATYVVITVMILIVSFFFINQIDWQIAINLRPEINF